MKVASGKLTGPALDYAVGLCEGTLPASFDDWKQTWPRYSTDWAAGGPIIARWLHAFDHMQSERVCAIIKRPDMRNGGWEFGYGPTTLIAAMRAYIMLRIGYEVEIPEELMTPSS